MWGCGSLKFCLITYITVKKNSGSKAIKIYTLNALKMQCFLIITKCNRSAWSIMVIIIGNGHSDTSLNPGQGWLQFT